MQVRFADKELERLEEDADFNAGLPQAAVCNFRKVIQVIRAAVDERTFYAMKSLHYERLKGPRSSAVTASEHPVAPDYRVDIKRTKEHRQCYWN